MENKINKEVLDTIVDEINSLSMEALKKIDKKMENNPNNPIVEAMILPLKEILDNEKNKYDLSDIESAKKYKEDLRKKIDLIFPENLISEKEKTTEKTIEEKKVDELSDNTTSKINEETNIVIQNADKLASEFSANNPGATNEINKKTDLFIKEVVAEKEYESNKIYRLKKTNKQKREGESVNITTYINEKKQQINNLILKIEKQSTFVNEKQKKFIEQEILSVKNDPIFAKNSDFNSKDVDKIKKLQINLSRISEKSKEKLNIKNSGEVSNIENSEVVLSVGKKKEVPKNEIKEQSKTKKFENIVSESINRHIKNLYDRIKEEMQNVGATEEEINIEIDKVDRMKIDFLNSIKQIKETERPDKINDHLKNLYSDIIHRINKYDDYYLKLNEIVNKGKQKKLESQEFEDKINTKLSDLVDKSSEDLSKNKFINKIEDRKKAIKNWTNRLIEVKENVDDENKKEIEKIIQNIQNNSIYQKDTYVQSDVDFFNKAAEELSKKYYELRGKTPKKEAVAVGEEKKLETQELSKEINEEYLNSVDKKFVDFRAGLKNQKIDISRLDSMKTEVSQIINDLEGDEAKKIKNKEKSIDKLLKQAKGLITNINIKIGYKEGEKKIIDLIEAIKAKFNILGENKIKPYSRILDKSLSVLDVYKENLTDKEMYRKLEAEVKILTNIFDKIKKENKNVSEKSFDETTKKGLIKIISDVARKGERKDNENEKEKTMSYVFVDNESGFVVKNETIFSSETGGYSNMVDKLQVLDKNGAILFESINDKINTNNLGDSISILKNIIHPREEVLNEVETDVSFEKKIGSINNFDDLISYVESLEFVKDYDGEQIKTSEVVPVIKDIINKGYREYHKELSRELGQRISELLENVSLSKKAIPTNIVEVSKTEKEPDYAKLVIIGKRSREIIKELKDKIRLIESLKISDEEKNNLKKELDGLEQSAIITRDQKSIKPNLPTIDEYDNFVNLYNKLQKSVEDFIYKIDNIQSATKEYENIQDEERQNKPLEKKEEKNDKKSGTWEAIKKSVTNPEFYKQIGKSLAGAVASNVGIKSYFDFKEYKKQKKEVFGEEGLKKSIEDFTDIDATKMSKESASDKVWEAINNLEDKLKHTKEGLIEGSEMRIKLYDLLRNDDRKNDENKVVRNKEIANILDNYTETKVTGMQVAKETLNSAIVASSVFLPGMIMARGFVYSGVEAFERYNKLNKKNNRENPDNPNKKAKLIKDVLWGSVKETFSELVFQDKTKKKTGLQIGLDFAKAVGKIARYVGLGITGYSVGFGTSKELYDSILDNISDKKQIEIPSVNEKIHDIITEGKLADKNIEYSGEIKVPDTTISPAEGYGAEYLSNNPRNILSGDDNIQNNVASLFGDKKITPEISVDQTQGVEKLPVSEEVKKVVSETLKNNKDLNIENISKNKVAIDLMDSKLGKDHVSEIVNAEKVLTIKKGQSLSEVLHKAMSADSKITVINTDGTTIEDFDANLVHPNDTVVLDKDGNITLYKTSNIHVGENDSLVGRYEEISKDLDKKLHDKGLSDSEIASLKKSPDFNEGKGIWGEKITSIEAGKIDHYIDEHLNEIKNLSSEARHNFFHSIETGDTEHALSSRAVIDDIKTGINYPTDVRVEPKDSTASWLEKSDKEIDVKIAELNQMENIQDPKEVKVTKLLHVLNLEKANLDKDDLELLINSEIDPRDVFYDAKENFRRNFVDDIYNPELSNKTAGSGSVPQEWLNVKDKPVVDILNLKDNDFKSKVFGDPSGVSGIGILGRRLSEGEIERRRVLYETLMEMKNQIGAPHPGEEVENYLLRGVTAETLKTIVRAIRKNV